MLRRAPVLLIAVLAVSCVLVKSKAPGGNKLAVLPKPNAGSGSGSNPGSSNTTATASPTTPTNPTNPTNPTVATPASPTTPANPTVATPATPAAAGKPAWCGKFEGQMSYSARSIREELAQEDLGKRYHLANLLYLHQALCEKPNDAEMKAAVTEARAAWMRDLQLTEADLADITPILGERYMPVEVDLKIEGTRLADLSAADEADFVTAGVKWAPEGRVAEAAWWLDGMAKGPRMPARARFVLLCARSLESSPVRRAGTWAVCAEDARLLNRAAFDTDLGQVNDPRKRLDARIEFGLAALYARTIEAEMQKLAADDPGIKMMLVDVPAKARADWKAMDTPGSAFALAREIEDAYRSGKRSQLQDCGAKLKPLWKELVDSTTVEAGLDPAAELVKTPKGYALGYAMALCFKEDSKANVIIAEFFGDALRHCRDWRGERFAVMNAIFNAASEIKFDRRELKFDPQRDLPNFTAKTFSTIVPGRLSYRGSVRGIVDKVEVKGDEVLVTFKTESFKDQVCDQWKETNRIDRIEDGKIVYREVCAKVVWKTFKETPDPVTVPAFLAAGIEKGRWASFVRTGTEKGAAALPIEVWDGKDKKKMVGRMGILK